MQNKASQMTAPHSVVAANALAALESGVPAGTALKTFKSMFHVFQFQYLM